MHLICGYFQYIYFYIYNETMDYFLLWIRTTTMLLPCTWSATCNIYNETMVCLMRLLLLLLFCFELICYFYHSHVYKSFMIMKLWIVLWDCLFSDFSRLGSIVGWLQIFLVVWWSDQLRQWFQRATEARGIKTLACLCMDMHTLEPLLGILAVELELPPDILGFPCSQLNVFQKFLQER